MKWKSKSTKCATPPNPRRGLVYQSVIIITSALMNLRLSPAIFCDDDIIWSRGANIIADWLALNEPLILRNVCTNCIWNQLYLDAVEQILSLIKYKFKLLHHCRRRKVQRWVFYQSQVNTQNKHDKLTLIAPTSVQHGNKSDVIDNSWDFIIKEFAGALLRVFPHSQQ